MFIGILDNDFDWFNNPYIEDNKSLWEELKLKGKKGLAKYYENVDYLKVRNGQK